MVKTQSFAFFCRLLLVHCLIGLHNNNASMFIPEGVENSGTVRKRESRSQTITGKLIFFNRIA